MFTYRCAVLGSGVALIAFPVIHGVLLGNAQHVVIAIGLGKYRCCCYAHEGSIALYDRVVRDARVWCELVTVNEQMLGTYLQSVDGAVHGKNRCPQNIHPVNLGCCHYAYRPCDGFALYYLAQMVALCLGKLFRVIQQLVRKVGWQNHCRCIYVTGKASSAGFIAAGFNDSLSLVWL